MSNSIPLKPLHRRPDFILSIVAPFLLSILVGLSILYTERPGHLCFSAQCYENLIQILKIPIAIMALAFPLAGMVAAYHRSIETNEQIRIAQANNTFSNYIKHRDDFKEYLESYLNAEYCTCRIVDLRKLYRLVFPENTYTALNTHIPDASQVPILVEIENIHKKAIDIDTAKHYSDDELISLYLDINTINKKLKLIPKDDYFISIKYNDHLLDGVAFSDDFPLDNIEDLIAIANHIKRFVDLPLLTMPEWASEKTFSKATRLFLRKYELDYSAQT